MDRIFVCCDHCGTLFTAPNDGKIALTTFTCSKCASQLTRYWEDHDRRQAICPHGVEGPCDACDRASDFAYDANWEGRH